MIARDVDRGRWAQFIAAAITAAQDPAEAAPGLYSNATIANDHWVIPVEGRAEGLAVHGFLYMCRAYGKADTVKLRLKLCDALKAGAETLQQLFALDAAPPPAFAPRKPYADD